MNITELHPEEALDLYEAGALGPRELEALKAHLARCPSCAAHVGWRSDVQAKLAELAVGGTEGWRLAAAALAGQGIPDPAKGEARPAGRSRRRMMVAAVVVAASLVSAVASARFWPSIERAWQRLGAPVRSPRSPRPAQPTLPLRTAAPPPPAVDDRQPPSVRPAPPPPRLTVPLAENSPGPRRRRAVDGVAGTGSRSPFPATPTEAALDAPAPDRTVAPVPSFPSMAPQPPVSAGRLFADVARARRAGWVTEAYQAYGDLVARFPGSREERAASVLLGQLTLERGERADALARFDRYLGSDPEGALAEEARLGRALALEQLGQRDDARRAWQELLDRHPGSVHAGRARARLESLRSEARGRQDPSR
jgi:tetratricopeptide (TPR) repeat protein